MSTIKADSLVAADGTSPVTLAKQSAAKAWANTGNGTTTRDSFNLASMVDNGTGDYHYNFTNTMINNDFTTLTSAFRDSNAYTGIFEGDQTTALTKTRHYNRGTATRADVDSVYINVHGDLA